MKTTSVTKRVLPMNDPRVQPAPEQAYREHRSLRLSHHRYLQLQAEVEDPSNDLARQDIIDTALAEYFAARYSSSSE